MTTTTLTLADFLLARIACEERAARAVLAEAAPEYGVLGQEWDDRRSSVTGTKRGSSLMFIPAARVLAECEAKRQVVKWHRLWPVVVDFDQGAAWSTERAYRYRYGTEPSPSPVLRHLASVYADHPDYDEAWRPR